MSQFEQDKSLIISLKVGIARYQQFDFNRFRYFNVPLKKELTGGKYANRDELVRRWFTALHDDQTYSDRTKFGYVNDLVRYVKFVDSSNLDLETRESIIAWERHQVEKVRLGSLNVNTARKRTSSIKCMLTILGLPCKDWFSPRGLFRRELNPTEGYSDSELKSLLKPIYSTFNKLFEQILSTPELHLYAEPRVATAEIVFGPRRIEVAGTITKCFSLGYFLMSYFTWGNMTSLLSMKKFKESNFNEERIYSQSVLKARANKYVTISIGENNRQNVPKHSLRFIKKLLQLSHAIAPNSEHLFFMASRGKLKPLEPSHLKHTSTWLQSTFNLFSDDNLPLRPMAKRFRATGSARYIDLTGDYAGASILLGNTPNTLRQHYTTGNPIENKKQLQAATHTLEAVARCSDLAQAKSYAKSKLDVEVLPYEQFLAKYGNLNKHSQKTALGSGCISPFGKQASVYRRKINLSPMHFDVDHLACADILNCFDCPNQVIIEEVEDIWCLMSFREVIEESITDHKSHSQFVRNFASLVEKIDLCIFSVDPKVRRKATKKLKQEGRHPIWPEGINYNF